MGDSSIETMLPTCSTPYEPNIKRRNRPPPVQVTRNILSMKQYDVLSVQKEKSKVEIEKIKLESIKLSDRY